MWQVLLTLRAKGKVFLDFGAGRRSHRRLHKQLLSWKHTRVRLRLRSRPRLRLRLGVNWVCHDLPVMFILITL